MNSVVESLLKLLTLVRSPLAVKTLINDNKGKFSFIRNHILSLHGKLSNYRICLLGFIKHRIPCIHWTNR
jgi:hypothetical protein